MVMHNSEAASFIPIKGHAHICFLPIHEPVSASYSSDSKDHVSDSEIPSTPPFVGQLIDLSTTPHNCYSLIGTPTTYPPTHPPHLCTLVPPLYYMLTLKDYNHSLSTYKIPFVRRNGDGHDDAGGLTSSDYGEANNGQEVSFTVTKFLGGEKAWAYCQNWFKEVIERLKRMGMEREESELVVCIGPMEVKVLKDLNDDSDL